MSDWDNAVDEFVGFWGRLGDYTIHPDDRAVMQGRKGFETRLVPLPFLGPLCHARSYVLFLNPGLDDREVGYERDRADFTAYLQENLKGEKGYPYLQPQFAGHPGEAWARMTFGADVADLISDMVCIIQLVPYHSESGDVARSVAKRLPSTAAAHKFVHTALLPRVRESHTSLVVARGIDVWKITDEIDDRLVVYRNSECRRAYQTKNSRGGKLLRRRLSEMRFLVS